MSRRHVEALAGYGIPEADVAGVIGIDPKTLRKHYRQELRYGHVKANASRPVGRPVPVRQLSTHPTSADARTNAKIWLM